MKRYVIFIALLVMIFLTACGSDPLPPLEIPNFGENNEQEALSENQNNGQTNEITITPTHGGHINIAMPMPRTLNPLLNSDPALAQVLRLIFEPLIVFDDELRPIPNPAITESIVFAPSGQSLTITLRENIFWEDGTPITSADIAFSINILRNQSPVSAVYRPNVEFISGHAVADSRTLHVNLSSPMWQVMYMLNFPIIPAHYYSGVSTTNLSAARNMHPVGNGPFRFHSYTLANRLELMANETAPGGRPFLGRVTAIVLREMDDADHAFSRGIIDIFAAPQSEWGRMRSIGRDLAAFLPAQNFDFIAFNHNRTIFAETNIRAAIALAAGDIVLPIQPNSWLAYNITINATNLAIEEAFAQAGFTPNENGILHRQLSPVLPSIPLTLTIIASEENLHATAYAHSLYSSLSGVGIMTTLNILPADIFAARVASSEYDLAVGTITLQNPINLDFIRNFGYSSSQFEALLNQARFAINATDFANAVAHTGQYLADNLPIIGLGLRGDVLYVSSSLHGYFSPYANNIFRGIQNWFLLD